MNELQKFLYDNKFESGRVILPGLELETDLPEGSYFRSDGMVRSMRWHAWRLSRDFPPARKLDWWNYTKKHQGSLYLGGLHLQFEVHDDKANEHGKASIIFVRNLHDFALNTYILGHESTHAAHYLGLEDQVVRYIRNAGFSMNPFETYAKDDEGIADIGGLVALHKIGCLQDFKSPSKNPYKKALLESRIKSVQV